ncbi:Uncharacterized protein HZ326_13443 [Fusarium oxysporum f. sp. albedinis]|nr:Uncharacterized protein HZ326_13443 [Fusarium oxysporum f. sp. albedinis]
MSFEIPYIYSSTFCCNSEHTSVGANSPVISPAAKRRPLTKIPIAKSYFDRLDTKSLCYPSLHRCRLESDVLFATLVSFLTQQHVSLVRSYYDDTKEDSISHQEQGSRSVYAWKFNRLLLPQPRASPRITDDQLLVQEPNGRFAPGTGGSGWQSKDLCTACQSVNLNQLCSNGTLYDTEVSLHISKTSTCPLCRFLTSQWRHGDIPVGSEDAATIKLSRCDINGIDHVCILHEDKFEYILQITDNELLKEAGEIGQYRQIDPSHVDYHMIRKWIAHCCRTHGKSCQMLTANPLQIAKFRLLDCKTKDVMEITDFVE